MDIQSESVQILTAVAAVAWKLEFQVSVRYAGCESSAKVRRPREHTLVDTKESVARPNLDRDNVALKAITMSIHVSSSAGPQLDQLTRIDLPWVLVYP